MPGLTNMQSSRVLFLQPRPYFEELLGCDFDEGITAVFGICFSLNVSKHLSKFDLVVSCLDHDISCRKLCEIAEGIGIPTAYFMDGIYDNDNAKNSWVFKKNNTIQFGVDCYTFIFTPSPKSIEKLNLKSVVFKYIPMRVHYLVSQDEGNRRDILIPTANTPYIDELEKESLISLLTRLIVFLDAASLPYKLRLFDGDLLKAVSDRLGYLPKNYTNSNFEDYAYSGLYLFSTISSVFVPFNQQGGVTIELSHRSKSSTEDFVDYSIGNEFSLRDLENIFKIVPNFSSCSEKLVDMKCLVDEALSVERNLNTSSSNIFPKFYLNFNFVYRYVYKVFKINKYKKQLLRFLN